MKNPFEAPQNPKKENPEEVDIYVGDLGSDFGSGLQEITPEDIETRHAEAGAALAPERDRRIEEEEKVAEAFFVQNPFLKARFQKDPGAMSRFKDGLSNLIRRGSRTYVMEPKDLPSDPRFQEDLVKYSFEFEEEEAERKAGKRAA